MMLSKAWLEVLSELFVNIAAGWFAIVFIEPQLGGIRSIGPLLFRLILGMFSLVVAKFFREEAKKYA